MIQWLQTRLGLSPELEARLLGTLVTVMGLWLLHRLALALVYRRVRDPWIRYRWRKSSTYALLATGIVIVGRMWFAGVQALATFLGLVGAGLAIALKDPVSNLAGWAFIMWRRPFEVGDRVQVGPHAGDVIDLGLFQFTLNEITEPIANYDKGFKYIWNEVPVLVTFESDWRKAKQILTKIAVQHAQHLTAGAEQELLTASRQYVINYTKLTPIVYTRVVQTGAVQLTIRYLIEPRKRRGTEHAIWEDVLTEFARCPDIELAYQTTRSFKRTDEGKEALRTAPLQSRASPQPTPADDPDD